MYYAQISGGIVTAVTQTSAVIHADDMIPLDGLRSELCGHSYNPATGTFTPPAPVAAAQTVTALQGLLALDDAGLGSAYQAWASSADRSFAERAFIDKAQNWRRNDPTLLAAASAFGLSDEDLDTLFAAAAQIAP